MSTLNDSILKLKSTEKLNAVTDITGFGFMGHLCEMLGKDLSAEIFVKSVPIL